MQSNFKSALSLDLVTELSSAYQRLAIAAGVVAKLQADLAVAQKQIEELQATPVPEAAE
jgi:hypothetical protein